MEIASKPGMIVLRHTKGFAPVAWAIRKLISSHWNHVGEMVVDGDNSIWVIEADPPVVKKTPWAEYIDSKKFDIKIVKMRSDAFATKKEYKQAIIHSICFLRAMVGSRYDKRAILWLALTYSVLGFLKGVKMNPFHGRKEFFCSELLCSAWHNTSSIMTHLFAGLKYPEASCSVTTPRDISKAISVVYRAGVDKN